MSEAQSPVNRIEVAFKQDPETPGTWLVHVAEDDRLHSFGRTVRSARRAILQVIELRYRIPASDLELVEIHQIVS